MPIGNARILSRAGTAWRIFRQAREHVLLFDAVRFLDLYRRVKGYTRVSPPGLLTLYRLGLALERNGVAGDIVECGVFNGGSAAVLAYSVRHNAQRRIWLFDSFQGLPAPTHWDGSEVTEGFHEGWCRGDRILVHEVLRRVGVPQERVRIEEGWFEDTFPTTGLSRIALLHVDADWYESVKLVLNTFFDRVESRGFIIIDDYHHWPGCRRATDEFLLNAAPSTTLHPTHNRGVYFQKQ